MPDPPQHPISFPPHQSIQGYNQKDGFGQTPLTHNTSHRAIFNNYHMGLPRPRFNFDDYNPAFNRANAETQHQYPSPPTGYPHPYPYIEYQSIANPFYEDHRLTPRINAASNPPRLRNMSHNTAAIDSPQPKVNRVSQRDLAASLTPTQTGTYLSHAHPPRTAPMMAIHDDRQHAAPVHHRNNAQLATSNNPALTNNNASELHHPRRPTDGPRAGLKVKPTPNPAQTVPKSSATFLALIRLHPYTNDAPILQVDVPGAATRRTMPTSVATRARNHDPARTTHSPYGRLTKDYPTSKAAPPLDVDIGALEIYTFLPNAKCFPEVAARAQMNDWGRQVVVKAELSATDSLNSASQEDLARAYNRVQKQFSSCGKAMFVVEKDWKQDIPKNAGYTGNQDLTATNWHFGSQWKNNSDQDQFEHVALKSIYSRVPRANWPQGPDRLTLTECLEFAAANEHLDLDTSHWDFIMQVLGLPKGAYLNADHDKEAAERLKRRLS